MEDKKIAYYHLFDDELYMSADRNEEPDFEQSGDISQFSFLGQNKKGIGFLVNYPSEQYLPQNQLDFLSKILSAIKLGLDDIAILNVATHMGKEKELPSIFRKMVFLGPQPFPFGFQDIQINKYEIAESDGKVVLYCDTLDLISKSTDMKGALWTNLQRMFTV